MILNHLYQFVVLYESYSRRYSSESQLLDFERFIHGSQLLNGCEWPQCVGQGFVIFVPDLIHKTKRSSVHVILAAYVAHSVQFSHD